MSIFASILRSVYKLSGAKKAFALPEDALRKEIEKQNRHRGVFTPTDRKAYYETIAVNGFPCLIVREHPKPSERAILYFFGGGMVIGPDKGDLPVMRKLCRETGCDVWFPFYPLCMEHCITETYAMVYECYRKMITLYGGGNVSTCGFSSGGALALGINSGAYVSEIIRGGLMAVDPGQIEAAHALGMTYPQTLRRIILPEAFEVALPTLGNSFISIIKGTSLAFTCAVVEITAQGQIIGGRTYRYFEVYVSLAIIYWLVTLVIEQIIRVIENKIRIPDQVELASANGEGKKNDKN